jgi:hypothetical protein
LPAEYAFEKLYENAKKSFLYSQGIDTVNKNFKHNSLGKLCEEVNKNIGTYLMKPLINAFADAPWVSKAN